MEKLAPQIQYWLETGWVAKNKIVNLLMPEVCSIPRGKVGKDVEFGIKWGFTRLGGGFIIGSIGALKSGRYTFDKPNVRSTAMMETCGHRSVLGYNLNRLVALDAIKSGVELVGA